MPKYLVKADDGFIYSYHPIAAKRNDMLPADTREEAEKLSAKILKAPLVEDEDAGLDDGDFVVSKATKKELEAFALREFNVDLDKRKHVDTLRHEVAEMLGLEQ